MWARCRPAAASHDLRELDQRASRAQRLDALLAEVEVGEVAFQAGCQAADVRALLADSLRAPQKKLAAMRARVRKHLGASAPALAAAVWARLQAELLRRYGRLEEQLALCYPALRLAPSPAELQALFAAVG